MADVERTRVSRMAECTGCGKAVHRSRSSASVQYCLGCRRAGRASPAVTHGTTLSYRRGCRCAECSAKNTANAQEYRARRMAVGLTSLPRAMKSAICEQCDEAFETRADKVGRFCSRDCRMLAEHGWVETPNPRRRFRPSNTLRDSVLERDGWLCHLCGDAVDTSAHYLDGAYPSLDHVVPMSQGGEDTVENLKTAHRLCNSRRGVKAIGEAVHA